MEGKEPCPNKCRKNSTFEGLNIRVQNSMFHISLGKMPAKSIKYVCERAGQTDRERRCHRASADESLGPSPNKLLLCSQWPM